MPWKDNIISNGVDTLKRIDKENHELLAKVKTNDAEADEILNVIKSLEPKLRKATVSDLIAEKPVEMVPAEEKEEVVVEAKANNTARSHKKKPTRGKAKKKPSPG